MKKYIFPTNYKYANKFLGLIEYRVLLPLSIYGSVIFFILYFLKLDIFWSIGIFIVLFLPPAILLSVGVQREPFFPFLKSIYKFNKNAKVYLYKRRRDEKPSAHNVYGQTRHKNQNIFNKFIEIIS